MYFLCEKSPRVSSSERFALAIWQSKPSTFILSSQPYGLYHPEKGPGFGRSTFTRWCHTKPLLMITSRSFVDVFWWSVSQFNLSNAKSSAFKASRSVSFAIERAVNKGNSTKLFAEKLRVTSIISDNMLKSDSKSLFSGTPILYAEGQFVACHFSPSNYVPFRKIGKKHLEEELRRAMCTEDSRTDALFEVGKNSLIKMKKKNRGETWSISEIIYTSI